MIVTTLSVIILCSNLNWEYSPRCTAPVAEFHQTTEGFHGTLESDVEWKQTIITPEIHRFEMEDVDWYIINGKKVVI